MFKNLKNFNPAEIEEKVLEFWRTNKIFEKSIEKPALEKPKGNYTFFDGPPFANGLPHYGHILASIIKDAIPRYQTMKGKSVKRRWGWDCHGLPVEFEIEKELGLKNKKDIINFGVEKFNEAARVSVLKYESEWKKTIPRIGRWVDMDNSYKTMDVEYMESVLSVFKDLYDKDLIYKGYKPMHICPRCETTLSNFEVTQNYKDIEDFAVTLKFELVNEPKTFVLAWTTTAWTLPGNVALAVNPKITYVKIKTTGNEKYILAEERLGAIKEKYEITEKFKGDKLIGKIYKPLFDYYCKENATPATLSRSECGRGWKIYPADFINIEEGTGIVHIAPAFGAEDMELGQKFNLPFIQHVGMDGKLKQEVKNFVGLKAKPRENTKETDEKIISFLSEKKLVFDSGKVVHSYPHCWRCETPLLNYAASSWFVKVSAIKNSLVKINQKINWLPGHVKDGRFGQWLKDAKDWAISRSRFWGSPLPVWECGKCGKLKVVGSIEEIKKNSESSGNKYFVMRHGQAESNLFNITSSNYKNSHHVTETGKKEIAASLKNIKGIDIIFASDFVRTKETAEMAARHLGIKKVFYDKRLREVNVGIFNNKPMKEYHAYFSSIGEKFIKPSPKGENLTQLKNRVSEFLYEIDGKYSNKNILIIGHEYPIWLLFAGAEGADAKKAIEIRDKKKDFIKTGEIKNLKFAPLPHNKNFELDLHRPYIDRVEFSCPHSSGSRQVCGGKMKRIEDVFDCWFESGSMPYGQSHYPFAQINKDILRKSASGPLPSAPMEPVPAEFIAEGMDQTRGWFYTLLVLSTALFNKPAYKNVIVNGIILAENGQKMSKRLKNYPDPMELVSKYGADSLRLYLLSSPVVAGENLNFSEKGVDEIYKKMILRLWNTYKFYEMYADGKVSSFKLQASSKNVLDNWIIARLEQLKQEVSNALENYELDKAVRPLSGFIDDFSTWYIRRSRERFAARRIAQNVRRITQKELDNDKASAIATTNFVLSEFSKILAPFAPFIAEGIYLSTKDKRPASAKATAGKQAISVHLEKWPVFDKKLIDKDLLDSMAEIRKITSLALELRDKEGIKVRQPLASLKLKTLNLKLKNNKGLLSILADEINVKKVIFDPKIKGEIELDVKITPELKAEGLLREAVRAIQGLRKEAGLLPKDKINLWLEVPTGIRLAIEKNISEFKEKICAKNVYFSRTDKFDAETETKMDNSQIWAGIKKI